MKSRFFKMVLLLVVISVLSTSILIAATKTNTLNLTNENTLTDSQNIKYVSIYNDSRFNIDNIEYDEYVVVFLPTKKSFHFRLGKNTIQLLDKAYFNLDLVQKLLN